ncbi:MAG: crossover junction endodeoxyribonuclease RuvC [Desulfonauticus sp.]|nr:crossover junction endodeoxyribonuclease RuvC [Desulfonauticus sp.]
MRVLGLDPGSRCMGVGLVEEHNQHLKLVLGKAIYLPTTLDLGQKMGFIFSHLIDIIDQYRPQVVAIEDVFLAKNARAALKLGQARGAALAACAWKQLPIFSYEPTKVKQSIVGAGRADKKQVAFMVQQLLGCKESWPLDVSDALAVAIAHLNAARFCSYVGRKV